MVQKIINKNNNNQATVEQAIMKYKTITFLFYFCKICFIFQCLSNLLNNFLALYSSAMELDKELSETSLEG